MVINNQNLKRSHSLHKPSKRHQAMSANQTSLSPDQKQYEANLAHRSEHQRAAFSPLPGAAVHSFSSAVQFVSTTLKPLTEPSIAYPAGPLPSHLSRANGILLVSSRLASASNSTSSVQPTLINSNVAVKRSRTVTSSTLPTYITRKRSKSDFGSMNNKRESSHVVVCENVRPACLGRKRPGFGSSTSLLHSGKPDSLRRRPTTPDVPSSLIRHKQRLAEFTTDSSTRQNKTDASPYPRYMSAAVRSSSSLKSASSVTSISTLYPSRSRAQSQLNAIPSDLQEDSYQPGPVRRTYLGGVGVYLNPEQYDEEKSMDEINTPSVVIVGDSKEKPPSIIDAEESCSSSQLSKSTGSWYNRLLLSPLSSASSSIYSFLVNSTASLPSSDDSEGMQDNIGTSEVGSSNQKSSISLPVTRLETIRGP